MGVTVASQELTDQDFLDAFAAGTLPLSSFKHGDHLRFAWLNLSRYPFDLALRNIRHGIQRYAAHHNLSGLYHETITVAWVRLLATHDERSFDHFIERNSEHLNSKLLHRYWNEATLKSDEARRKWVEPDIAPLP